MQTFNQFASKNIRIDQDASGLFALVPDASGKWMRVQCVESKTSVFASHCSCSTFAHKQHCNHVELVQAYWNRIYKPVVEAPVVVETPVAPKVRKPRNGLVRKSGNKLVLVAPKTSKVARVIDQSVQATLPTPKRDMMTAQFGNQGFQLMR
jgi:hypothetical protein